MITLYLAEKPSMARDLAYVLGAKKREEGHWVGTGIWVSWCIGHLVQIATPAEHEERWKSWRTSELPILPQTLKWIPSTRTKSHLRVLCQLMKHQQVSEIINACDAGREGELIFRTVYAHSKARAPVRRFWVSSLTHQAIKAGLNALRPSADFDALADAAYCRAEADWLVGMNATRALTSRASDLLSVGRVQTPTLSLVVSRQRDIEHFIPEDYWTLEAILSEPNGAKWQAKWRGSHEELTQYTTKINETTEENAQQSTKDDESQRGRFKTRQQAEAIAQRARQELGQVLNCQGKENSIPPPLLYHLTALQQEANRRYGYSAEQCLGYAQTLYERHKLISYPRTDSRHLTPDVATTLPKVLQALSQTTGALAIDAQAVLNGPKIKLNKRFVNAQRVTDHHAIVPTSKTPQLEALSEGERRIYTLIVRSILMAMSPHAIDFMMELSVDLAGGVWRATGRIERQAGWRRFSLQAANPTQVDEQLLPYLHPKTPVRAEDVKVSERQTIPPKPYSEATLLGAMEHAGRHLNEQALKEAIKGSGLGTPATRASIIETLLKRAYLYRDGKLLKATEAGKVLIDAITSLADESSQALCSPVLTAHWEQRLQRIADGEEPATPFISQVRAWVKQLSERLAQGPKVTVPQAKNRGLKRGGSTSQKDKKTSDFNKNQSHAYSSPQPKKAKGTRTLPQQVAGLSCPLCQQGRLLKGNRGWGCARWKEGCRFVLWFICDGIDIPEEEAIRLLVRKESRLFVRRDNRRWRLCLDLTVPSYLRWEAAKTKTKAQTKAKTKAKPFDHRSRKTVRTSAPKKRSNTENLGAQRWKKTSKPS